jgi:hypothetical protein
MKNDEIMSYSDQFYKIFEFEKRNIKLEHSLVQEYFPMIDFTSEETLNILKVGKYLNT